MIMENPYRIIIYHLKDKLRMAVYVIPILQTISDRILTKYLINNYNQKTNNSFLILQNLQTLAILQTDQIPIAKSNHSL